MGPDSHYMGGDLPAFFGALHIWGKELHFYSHTVPANSAALLSWWISRFFELFRASKHTGLGGTFTCGLHSFSRTSLLAPPAFFSGIVAALGYSSSRPAGDATKRHYSSFLLRHFWANDATPKNSGSRALITFLALGQRLRAHRRRIFADRCCASLDSCLSCREFSFSTVCMSETHMQYNKEKPRTEGFSILRYLVFLVLFFTVFVRGALIASGMVFLSL